MGVWWEVVLETICFKAAPLEAAPLEAVDIFETFTTYGMLTDGFKFMHILDVNPLFRFPHIGCQAFV